MARKIRILLVAACSALAACDGTFSPLRCAADDECGEGQVCGSEEGQPVCMPVKDAAIRVGMSAPISGPSQELGAQMKIGIALALDAQNEAGGVRGRKLVLELRDDAYQPALAEENARELLDARAASGPPRCPTTSMELAAGQPPVATTALDRGPGGVVALLGNVGTPTMLRAAPVALETGALFFGAFTGANKVLRDDLAGGCKRYVFNVRASYADEARAALELFFEEGVPDAAHLLSFDQDDSFGQAGYDGLVAAFEAMRGEAPSPPIQRFRYTRDDTSSVPAQVAAATAYLGSLLVKDAAPHKVGVLMTDTYGPATTFIKGVRDWQHALDAEQGVLDKAGRLDLRFVNLSFVGPNALADRLREAGSIATPQGPRPYTDGVLLSQVVPSYDSDDSDIVRDYEKALATTGDKPSFTSLEGYVVARIFLAGLVAHEGPFTPEALVETFEDLPRASLGLGPSAGFSSADHGYSKSVWGTALDDGGSFVSRYYWTEGSPLQLFE